MGYAFISYNSNSRAYADEIKAAFNKNSIDSWIAPDDIPVGSRYAQVINMAIKNCACFVLLLTENAMRSQWVAKEVERAIHYKKPIVPIRLEELVLTDEFELYISTDQILPLNDFDERTSALQNLITAVHAYVSASTYEKTDLEQELMEIAADAPSSAMPQPVKSASTRKTKRLLTIGVCIALVALILIAGSKVVDTLKNTSPTDPQLPSGNGTSIQLPEQTQPSDTAETTSATEASQNEIPSKYEDKVKALMYSNELALRNATLRVKVGEYVTPSAASVWGNVTIYSQDTSIAVGEGILVKGIAKGETYIVVESAVGSSSVYYIIVE